MSKRLLTKKFLTLPEAASFLNTALKEHVTSADLLQHALDGKLTLSLNLVQSAIARPVIITPVEKKQAKPDSQTFPPETDLVQEFETEQERLKQYILNPPSELYADLLTYEQNQRMTAAPGFKVRPENFCGLTETHTGRLPQWDNLAGLVDLTLLSSEKAIIQNLLLTELEQAEIPLYYAPILVQKPGSDTYYQLFEADDYLQPLAHHPSPHFPDSSQLCIRQEVIQDFIAKITEQEIKLPPSHHLVIAALLERCLEEIGNRDPQITQGKLAQQIEDKYRKLRVRGLSAGTTNKIFAVANDKMEDALKEY